MCYFLVIFKEISASGDVALYARNDLAVSRSIFTLHSRVVSPITCYSRTSLRFILLTASWYLYLLCFLLFVYAFSFFSFMLLVWSTNMPIQGLFRSNTMNVIQIPHTQPKSFGDKAFSAYAPRLWNGPPENIKAADSV